MIHSLFDNIIQVKRKTHVCFFFLEYTHAYLSAYVCKSKPLRGLKCHRFELRKSKENIERLKKKATDKTHLLNEKRIYKTKNIENPVQKKKLGRPLEATLKKRRNRCLFKYRIRLQSHLNIV